MEILLICREGMNRFLIAAFKLHLQKTNQPLHALFLLDRGLGMSGDECRRCLGPWGRWLVVHDVHLIDGEVGDDLFATLKPCPFYFVVGVSDRVEILDAIRTRCESLSLNYIDSTYPPPTGSNESLVQEVAHHDFEIGGCNEFDGAPVRHSTAILNQLSSTHCRQVFPMYVWSDLLALRAAANSRKLRTLDIGCGPISRLRWAQFRSVLRYSALIRYWTCTASCWSATDCRDFLISSASTSLI